MPPGAPRPQARKGGELRVGAEALPWFQDACQRAGCEQPDAADAGQGGVARLGALADLLGDLVSLLKGQPLDEAPHRGRARLGDRASRGRRDTS